MPYKLGTATPLVVGLVVGVGVAVGDGEPVDTTMLTELPLSTFSLAAGSWRMTWPAGTVVLVSLVGVPSFRPTPARAADAWS